MVPGLTLLAQALPLSIWFKLSVVLLRNKVVQWRETALCGTLKLHSSTYAMLVSWPWRPRLVSSFLCADWWWDAQHLSETLYKISEILFKSIKTVCSQSPGVHSCHPSYLGGWNQEYCGSRPTQANSSQDPMSKITRTKWTGRIPQGV
jgi:hypothetical protein